MKIVRTTDFQEAREILKALRILGATKIVITLPPEGWKKIGGETINNKAKVSSVGRTHVRATVDGWVIPCFPDRDARLTIHAILGGSSE